MSDAKKAVVIVVPLLVASLMGAFLFPIAVDQIAGPESETVTLQTGNSTTLQPDMTLTLDSTNATSDDATYTVNASGSTSTVTVANGTNTTTTVDGVDVTIAVTDVQTGQATADVDYPTDYGWGNGASALWGILPVIMVLALFLYFVFIAVQRL